MKKLKRIMLKTTAPRKGFTLIEMVVVLAIIALLMLIVIPNLNKQRENASKHQREALQEVVYNQAEMYQNDAAEHPNEPATLESLKTYHYLTPAQYDQAKRDGVEPQRPAPAKSDANTK